MIREDFTPAQAVNRLELDGKLQINHEATYRLSMYTNVVAMTCAGICEARNPAASVMQVGKIGEA